MDRSPALLLLLALGLCEYRHGLSPSDISQLRVGQRLELQCQTGKDSGASWIRQDRSGALHFIVFISSMSRATFSSDQRTPPGRFEASRDKTNYHLVVRSFTPQDEGNYFCVTIFNQMLFFSPGQPAFLPVTTTVAPTRCGPTHKCGTTEDPNPKTPDPERRTQEELDFSCHIFIWIPLAGACLLLLIALVITVVLCRRTRRRRCRCKR
ncbi:CD8A protein, partial [Daphoenositta chrysoptera]|nr:CD8A protein [Daphoenositta chrysoptera]